MSETIYTRADILALAGRLYDEAGGKARMIQRAQNYATVPAWPDHIHNYYYVHKDVFDYSDLNATLGQAALLLAGGGGARQAGQNYVELLCALADAGFLIDHTYCDKAFDGYALSLLAHSWLETHESGALAGVSTEAQRQKVEDWMYTRAQYMWRDRDADTWATFRPYDNQEIGVGGCVLLAELFAKRDPALAEGFRALADARLVGWEHKNGNLDDTLFYTPIFCMVSWFYARYRPRPELLTLDSCRHTFESYMQQQPGNGSFTLYNWTNYTSAPSMMALGAHLFRDGRYKWMACRLMEERMGRRNARQRYAARNITPALLNAILPVEGPDAHTSHEHAEQRQVVEEELARAGRYDHVWEGMTDNVFHLWYFWDDALPAKRPDSPGMVLHKTAGQGRWPYDPEPVLPDKVVFREGWGERDLFAMVNLWGGQNSPAAKTVSHRFPGSNEIISLVCGEQFLVQNTNQVTRDVFIRREELNAFNLMREGKWLNAMQRDYNPQKKTFGVYPTVEMYNAELRFFHRLPGVQASKSTLYDYYGWTSERTVVLCEGGYLAVFDQTYGPTEETAGVRWHLQGEETAANGQSLRLSLLGSGMTVCFPQREGWFTAKKAPNTRPIAVYQHHADLDLDLLATGRRLGFITLFAPEGAAVQGAEAVEVTCSGHPAHPEAMAVATPGRLLGTRLGQYRNDYDYGPLTTDAAAFVLAEDTSLLTLHLVEGQLVRLKNCPHSRLAVEGAPQGQMTAETHGDMLLLRFTAPLTGTVRVWR